MDLFKNLQSLALDDKKTTAHSARPAAALPAAQQSVFDKLGDALSGTHAADKKPVGHSPQPAVPAPPAHASVFGKINDALGGSHPTPAPVPEKSGTDKLLSMIGESLSGKPAAPTPAPKKDEGLFDKIGDAISGRKTPPPPAAPAKENLFLFGKLSSVIAGKPPAGTHETIADKINSALGGGKKSEAEEGKLDKAIDLFQEYVLKEGPQNNESAFEQAKDRKIADTIRAAIGQQKK